MRKGRAVIFGGVAGAALGVVLGPRAGESRRAALRRLRFALGSGRGSLDAFAGTPCADEGTASAQAEVVPGRYPEDESSPTGRRSP